MRIPIRIGHRVLSGVGLAALVVVVGPVASPAAASVSPTGPDVATVSYTVCADRGTGELRLAPRSRGCRAAEVNLHWRITAPPGSAGPISSQGAGIEPADAPDYLVVRQLIAVRAMSSTTAFLRCPRGTVAIDGSMGPAVGSGPGLELAQSFSWNQRVWVVVVENDAPMRRHTFVGALCVPGTVEVGLGSPLG